MRIFGQVFLSLCIKRVSALKKKRCSKEHLLPCRAPDLNRHSCYQPRDFKSLVSTNSTSSASCGIILKKCYDCQCWFKSLKPLFNLGIEFSHLVSPFTFCFPVFPFDYLFYGKMLHVMNVRKINDSEASLPDIRKAVSFGKSFLLV